MRNDVISRIINTINHSWAKDILTSLKDHYESMLIQKINGIKSRSFSDSRIKEFSAKAINWAKTIYRHKLSDESLKKYSDIIRNIGIPDDSMEVTETIAAATTNRYSIPNNVSQTPTRKRRPSASSPDAVQGTPRKTSKISPTTKPVPLMSLTLPSSSMPSTSFSSSTHRTTNFSVTPSFAFASNPQTSVITPSTSSSVTPFTCSSSTTSISSSTIPSTTSSTITPSCSCTTTPTSSSAIISTTTTSVILSTKPTTSSSTLPSNSSSSKSISKSPNLAIPSSSISQQSSSQPSSSPLTSSPSPSRQSTSQNSKSSRRKIDYDPKQLPSRHANQNKESWSLPAVTKSNLILGSSNLNRIDRSKINSNTQVESYPGAKIDHIIQILKKHQQQPASNSIDPDNIIFHIYKQPGIDTKKIRLIRENYWINKLQTMHPLGMNIQVDFQIIPFVIQYNNTAGQVPRIIIRLYKELQEKFPTVFTNDLVIAYTRNKNLNGILVRGRLPPIPVP
ncbi:hypothetical protein LOTGIDRAFT_174980 [Lottia gigantea]|uniref:Uncharacterized protein n=1 Tax=Lottia gigantea TaxID=225164 RepID=V4AGI9_LOTGI|nr:hypothetical protein LOTGIDRAFT_174980 [Lottia gigantea]ESO95997.1 hypothetical protein LOTGIDRAFT_174980 [Lottia gigantea]